MAQLRTCVLLSIVAAACADPDPAASDGTTSTTAGSESTSSGSNATTTAMTSDADTSSGAATTDASTSTTDTTGTESGATSSEGGEDNGEETGADTGEPACPEGDEPPGPAIRKFDVATFSCGMTPGCPADDDQCFCSDHFEVLDVGPPHYMATGTDNHKAEVWAAGNFQAVYVDDLNTNWMDGGEARADAMIANAMEDFDCGVPAWFIVNEISASQWPDNAAYRAFVIDFATTMDIDHGKQLVVAAPFDGPGAHAADWSALADHAFIAAESYLSGAEINGSGNQVAWCADRYQETIDAYDALGVDLDRLFLIEHFGQTTPDRTWGRAGVSVAGWHNAIEARTEAAAMLGFAGFVSYAWSWNLMHENDENRLAFEATYVALDVP